MLNVFLIIIFLLKISFFEFKFNFYFLFSHCIFNVFVFSTFLAVRRTQSSAPMLVDNVIHNISKIPTMYTLISREPWPTKSYALSNG